MCLRSSTVQTKCYERLCEVMRNYCKRNYEKIRKFNRNVIFGFVEEWLTFSETILKWILKVFSYLVNYNLSRPDQTLGQEIL
jgi:hypothetical protein